MGTKILVVNPGNTSTKVAVFRDEEKLKEVTIIHSGEDLKGFRTVLEQKDYRLDLILRALSENGFKTSDMNVVMGRGGIGKPIEGGLYAITKEMLDDVGSGKYGEHAANLGPFLAKAIADKEGIPSYVMDPVSIDEMEPEARLSGLKELPRKSLIHALNSRATAKAYSREVGKKYEDLRLIVVHLGSGISVTPHLGGRMIDCNNPLEAGPMCPDRAGTLPAKSLIQLCYSKKYKDGQELIKKINREGGLYDHLGTKDLREVEKMVKDGDSYAELVLKAMVYQIGKEIGAMATVLKGKVDAIILTGGMANSKGLVGAILERVSFIAPIRVMPGEYEMDALAKGALEAVNNEIEIKTYL